MLRTGLGAVDAAAGASCPPSCTKTPSHARAQVTPRERASQLRDRTISLPHRRWIEKCSTRPGGLCGQQHQDATPLASVCASRSRSTIRGRSPQLRRSSRRSVSAGDISRSDSAPERGLWGLGRTSSAPPPTSDDRAGWASYALKRAINPLYQASHLGMNGDRVAHHSQGFLTDLIHVSK